MRCMRFHAVLCFLPPFPPTLRSRDVFLVDTGLEIFVWVGLAASESEQMNAFQTVDSYLEQSSRPLHTPVHVYREGQQIKNEIWQTIFDF